MKTLYLDVSAGAAGDMLMAALYGLCPDPAAFLQTMNALALPGIHLQPQPVEDHGCTGIHMSVSFYGVEEAPEDPHGHSHGHHGHHHHEHRKLEDVLGHIRAFPLPAPVLDDACAVYRLIAQAEARAHGQPVAEVHFHEVGMNDAIADITGVCLLIHLLAPDRICATPVATGSGHVHCAHGVLPVPAPATAFLLEGLPTVPGPAACELCTPTGAALLRHFSGSFGPMPEGSGACARGMGTRRFPGHCNAVTARLVETA